MDLPHQFCADLPDADRMAVIARRLRAAIPHRGDDIVVILHTTLSQLSSEPSMCMHAGMHFFRGSCGKYVRLLDNGGISVTSTAAPR